LNSGQGLGLGNGLERGGVGGVVLGHLDGGGRLGNFSRVGSHLGSGGLGERSGLVGGGVVVGGSELGLDFLGSVGSSLGSSQNSGLVDH